MFDFHGRVGIKICGLTSPADAVMCADLGAEMLGLNFSPHSLRCVALPAAKEIVAAVRSQVEFVGVFVDQAREFVELLVRELSLDAVQLHGDETEEYMRALQAPFVIKVVRVRDAAPDLPKVDAVLLDSWSAKNRGGTGEAFDWSIGSALRPRIERLILAGGLNPENVAGAIREVRPDAVDVCSGVEERPGRKDRAKVQRFVEACR